MLKLIQYKLIEDSDYLNYLKILLFNYNKKFKIKKNTRYANDKHIKRFEEFNLTTYYSIWSKSDYIIKLKQIYVNIYLNKFFFNFLNYYNDSDFNTTILQHIKLIFLKTEDIYKLINILLLNNKKKINIKKFINLFFLKIINNFKCDVLNKSYTIEKQETGRLITVSYNYNNKNQPENNTYNNKLFSKSTNYFNFEKVANLGISDYYNKYDQDINKNDDNYFLFTLNILIGQIRGLKRGDKLSGRYGNKGVVGKVVNKINLPFSSNLNLTPDIIISPLSIVSRMNLSQLLEGKLNKKNYIYNKNWLINTNLQNIYINNYINLIETKLKYVNYNKKINVYDLDKIKFLNGMTGDTFMDKAILNYSFFSKLLHTTLSKINVRSQENYILLTQQPEKGKSKIGGQRFGEMEVWALEAFLVSYTLNELLTVLSDSDELKSEDSILFYLKKKNPNFKLKSNILNRLKFEFENTNLFLKSNRFYF